MIDYTLYLVTDTCMCAGIGVGATVEAAIEGGATLVQVRDPDADDATFLHIARAAIEAAAGRVPVLLNDRVHLVTEAGAQGAHIGQGDMPVAEARAMLGADAVLGLSITTEDELTAALPWAEQLDYLGVGPIWTQTTKLDANPPIGIAGLTKLVSRCPWPAVAIGGISLQNIGEIARAGAAGAAVVSAICGQPDPQTAASALRKAWLA